MRAGTASHRVSWGAHRGRRALVILGIVVLAACDPSETPLDVSEDVTRLMEEGELLLQQEDYEGAIAKFEQVLEIDPEHPGAHYLPGMCHYLTQDYAAATQYWERLIELAPEDPLVPWAHRGLGLIAHAQDPEAVIFHFNKALEPAAPDDPVVSAVKTAAFDGASLYFRDNDPESARTLAEWLLEVDPAYYNAHFLLGLIYASSDTARAVYHLEKFLELAPPDHPERATAQEMLGYLR